MAEYGTLRFVLAREEAEPPAPVELPVPGSVRFGTWAVEAAPAAAARWPCPQPRSATG